MKKMDADDTCESLYRIVASGEFPDIYPNMILAFQRYPDMTRRTAVSYFLDGWEDRWVGVEISGTLREQIGKALQSLMPPGGVDPAYHITLQKEFGIVL
jgi:hypothetical protein